MKSEISKLAINYAKMFSDPTEIPARYRGSKRKTRDDTKILREFNIKIKDWELTLTNIHQHFHIKEADRLIKITPICEKYINSVADSYDFNLINDYMLFKRDVEVCGDGELGCLALLSVAIQNKIEMVAGLLSSKTITFPEVESKAQFEQQVLNL